MRRLLMPTIVVLAAGTVTFLLGKTESVGQVMRSTGRAERLRRSAGVAGLAKRIPFARGNHSMSSQ